MANLKDLQEQAEQETKTLDEATTFPPVSLEEEQKTGAPIGASIWDEIQESADILPDNQTLCALVGAEGAGKTGIVLDSLTDEEIKDGEVIFVLDFDGGGQTIRTSHHRAHSRNIRVLSPWVMQSDTRDAFDYPATHARVMNIGRTR